MSAKSHYQVINPPNILQAKIPKTGGPSLSQMAADAETALREIKDNYETVVQADVRRIDDALARVKQSPAGAAGALEEIFGISHDIKGQAASLGYPLLTAIAQSLCRFISTNDAAALTSLNVVTVHTRAMGTVVGHKIRGDGGELGEKLLGALDVVMKKAISKD